MVVNETFEKVGVPLVQFPWSYNSIDMITWPYADPFFHLLFEVGSGHEHAWNGRFFDNNEFSDKNENSEKTTCSQGTKKKKCFLVKFKLFSLVVIEAIHKV